MSTEVRSVIELADLSRAGTVVQGRSASQAGGRTPMRAATNSAKGSMVWPTLADSIALK